MTKLEVPDTVVQSQAIGMEMETSHDCRDKVTAMSERHDTPGESSNQFGQWRKGCCFPQVKLFLGSQAITFFFGMRVIAWR